MRKILIDGGGYTGDSVAMFYANDVFLPRKDQPEYAIYVFEPNATDIPGATVIPKAMWIADGEVDFRNNDACDYTFTIAQFAMRNHDPVRKVPSVRFTSWLRTVASPEDYIVLKLDIEGAEYAVLRDLIGERMSHWINELYVEYHHTHDGFCSNGHNLAFDFDSREVQAVLDWFFPTVPGSTISTSGRECRIFDTFHFRLKTNRRS